MAYLSGNGVSVVVFQRHINQIKVETLKIKIGNKSLLENTKPSTFGTSRRQIPTVRRCLSFLAT